MQLIVTFASTAAAMAMEAYCRSAGVPGRIIPVPTQISAGCGLAWSAPLDSKLVIEQALLDCQLAAVGLHELELP
ncbi:MAG: DUF3343 domain-containing protein [Coriobacteriales bacterium]|jgi:hypothetical protein|nr:DUF3343 domain-containing protein [Coriobacteriales bacterium]